MRSGEWTTSKGACEACQSLEGKIVPRDVDVEEWAHPNCNCEIEPIEWTPEAASGALEVSPLR